ncbi:DUF4169 family protein [Sulfitobacter sp. HNIBRBA2951]|uniref:DUF4169 family protein n=1 Tax=Sulfitobacter aquimarinus TaxID=3158557 RepID=UPI0032DE4D2C
MSTPINLNKVRKDRARADAKARADENAVKFGLTKVQKKAAQQQRDTDTRSLDGHKREP